MDYLDRVEREGLLRGAVLAGDENAWRTWYEGNFDDLHHYVLWRCGGRRDWADEIVQETWLTAVRRVRHFDPRQGSFLAWLRGIAANILRNDLRRRRRLPQSQQTNDGHNGDRGRAESREEDRQREEQVAAALDALAEREEAVLRAKYLEGLSVAEIAATRGETPKAIESLLSRARQAFRDAYRGQGDDHADA
jgi:RNA polymerase sigma-70 factor (ECF subfamily)